MAHGTLTRRRLLASATAVAAPFVNVRAVLGGNFRGVLGGIWTS